MPLLALVLLGGLLTLAGVAHADGEAGVVVQNGDEVKTFCVPFKGESIGGDALLEGTGLPSDQFGGGARTVCSIENVGCFKSGSFDDCFCQCQGASCTYWAFFTRAHGKGWVYSSLAFNLTRAKDGDLQGWKWGKGGPQSAPAPNDVTFEQVCGHAPRVGAAAPPPAASIPATQQPTGDGSTTAGGTAEPSADSSAPPPLTSAPPGTTLTASVTIAGQPDSAASAASPAATRATGGGGDGPPAGILAFAVVVVALGGAAAAALIVRRRRHGR
jgi:hypothetical protein